MQRYVESSVGACDWCSGMLSQVSACVMYCDGDVWMLTVTACGAHG